MVVKSSRIQVIYGAKIDLASRKDINGQLRSLCFSSLVK